MRLLKPAIALMLLAAGTATAQSLPDASGEDPARLRTAEATGARVYRHDRAAALATDALRAVRKYRNDKRVGGWVTEAREDSIRVSFIDKAEPESAVVLYQVDVADTREGAGTVQAFDPPQAATKSQRDAARARRTAMAFAFTPCAKHYNTVIVPATIDGQPSWDVFLLPAATDKKTIPFGGTYRLELSADGASVTNSRTYTRSCIDFQRPKAKRAEVAMLFMTHLLEPFPTEAHVLLNLHLGTPVMLMTVPNRSVWKIERGRIQFLEKREPPPDKKPGIPIAAR